MEEPNQEKQEQRYQYQAQTAAQTQTEAKKETDVQEGTHRYCKYCEEPLAADQVFCPDCGEKHGGEENECPYCGQVTTKKNCPKCQNQIVPNTCPKCGVKSLRPVCVCGEVLDKKLEAMYAVQEKAAQESAATMRQMSAEEVRQVEELFRAEEENPDFIKFQKRLLEREKLLEEREYYSTMQREIVEVFGEHPFKIELPDPQEQAERMKLYASLERTIIERQRKATQAELEEKFPQLRLVHEVENRIAEEKAAAEEAERERRLEQAKRQKEMEERYSAILEGVDREIQTAQDQAQEAERAKKAEERERLLRQKAEEEALLKREREEAEKKAREEAERRARIAAEERAAAERAAAQAAADRRAMQEARERAQREAFQNRMLGTYLYSSFPCTIIIDSPTHARCIDGRTTYNEYALSVNGNSIFLKRTASSSNQSACFRGTLNNNGTVLTGYWYGSSTPWVYYKTR